MQVRYEFGPFRLDPLKRSVLRNDQPLEMEPKTYELLVFLIKNRDRAIERDELIRAIWKGTHVGENSLNYQINQLRNKLGDNKDNSKYIATISRHGYRFIADVKEISDDETDQKLVNQAIDSVVDSAKLESDEVKDPITLSLTLRLPRWNLKRRYLTFLGIIVGVVLIIGIAYFKILHKPFSPKAVIINSDGSWTALVPIIVEGIRLEIADQRFEVSKGDILDVTAEGEVDIGRGMYGPDGEPDYGDPSMDSPFKDHVGGLEMWIGAKNGSKRYFIGSHSYVTSDNSGVPTLRVIESIPGYKDGNNSGYFRVTIRKVNRQ